MTVTVRVTVSVTVTATATGTVTATASATATATATVNSDSDSCSYSDSASEATHSGLGGESEDLLLERELLLNCVLGQEDEGQQLRERAAEPTLGHLRGRPWHAVLLPRVLLLLVPAAHEQRGNKTQGKADIELPHVLPRLWG